MAFIVKGLVSDGTLPSSAKADIAAAINTPGSQVRAAIDGLTQGFASKYASASTKAATAALMGKLERGVQDATVLAIGDSTGNGTDEHFYLTLQDIAARYPAYRVTYRVWNTTSNAYDPAVTVQAGTGSRTLAFYNCSASGEAPSYVLGTRWAAAVANVPEPDLIVISHGHNMGSPTYSPTGQSMFRWNILQLTEELTVQFPQAGMVLESQNPTTLAGRETWNAIKAQDLQGIAAQRGFGFIDIHQAFIDYAAKNNVTVDSLMSDQIHPTPTGSAVWSAAESGAFVYDRAASSPARHTSPLLQAGASLIPDPYFSTWTDTATPPPGWTITNATVEKDTTNYETGGFGVKITPGATAGGAYIRLESQTSHGNKGRIAGRIITVAARVFVPTGYTGLPSLIVKDNTGGSMQSRTDLFDPDSFGRFVWLFATKRISATGEWLAIDLYPRISGSATGSITVDRVLVTEGDLPREAVPTN